MESTGQISGHRRRRQESQIMGNFERSVVTLSDCVHFHFFIWLINVSFAFVFIIWFHAGAGGGELVGGLRSKSNPLIV